jgi:hypothetical protein
MLPRPMLLLFLFSLLYIYIFLLVPKNLHFFLFATCFVGLIAVDIAIHVYPIILFLVVA